MGTCHSGKETRGRGGLEVGSSWPQMTRGDNRNEDDRERP